ncbi:MAG: tetratricopeptide repeat protein, partial [Gemmataceae bacterium]
PVRTLEIEAYTKGNFPEAVLWIMARLAEGLSHAHERGIIHQDIKPANILLTDDGLPMLLDFNLASDKQGSRTVRGGTPAYMAPEQWAAVQNRTDIPDDPRIDLYSLAAVGYELLTGKRPARDAVNPPIHSINSAVSPSVNAILMKCLSIQPEHRYRTAAELAEDLNRQSRHEPLLHVREPSYRERMQKWSRRHPRLSSSGSIAVAAFLIVFLLGSFALVLAEKLHVLRGQRQASELLAQYYAELPDVTESLAFRGTDPNVRRDANEKLKDWKQRFGEGIADNRSQREVVSFLPDHEQRALRQSFSEMELLAARVESDLDVALERYDRAIEGFQPFTQVPRSVLMERNTLRQRRGLPEFALPSNEPNQTDARGDYLIGLYYRQTGKLREACEQFERAVSADPKHYWSWFSLGATRFDLGDNARAEGHFDACIALKPDWAMGYFNRGLVRMRLARTADAIGDFSRVLDLNGQHEEALYHRGLARILEQKHKDALADFDRLIAIKPTVRALIQRASLRQRFFNDAKGADEDRKQCQQLRPVSEVDFVSRGQERAEQGDAPGALADFDAALAINPRSFPALQNKAYVLSAKLQKDEESLDVLNQEMELYPDSLPARAGRAVLLARKNKRDAAHADVERCVKIGLNPEAAYQMANVYALTSRTHPDDAAIALRYLSDALRQGYGFQHLEHDTDLDPLRSKPEFKAIVNASKVIESQSNRRKEQP